MLHAFTSRFVTLGKKKQEVRTGIRQQRSVLFCVMGRLLGLHEGQTEIHVHVLFGRSTLCDVTEGGPMGLMLVTSSHSHDEVMAGYFR